MCGLVGVFGDFSISNDKIFEELLYIDTLRGDDSTGVAFISKKGNPEIAKELGPPIWLQWTDHYIHCIKRPNLALIGHNRAATRGAVDKNNAHPFTHGHITGAHNGTLLSTTDLIDADKFGTDSEAIVYTMSQIGIEETWKRINGAAAMSVWNKKDMTLHLMTNGERPLCFAYDEKKESLFWASERWMLKGILEKNRVKFNNTFSINPNYMFTFSYDGKVVSAESSELEARPKSQTWHQGRAYGGNYQRGWDDVFGANYYDEEDPNMVDLYDRNAHTNGHNTVMGPTKEVSDSDDTSDEESFPRSRIHPNGQVEWFNKDGTRIGCGLPMALDHDDQVSQDVADGFREGPNGIIITEADFDKHYSECYGCREALMFDDEDIEFLDINMAFCGDCASLSRSSFISYTAIN
jgi:predicted glutamine amidotransferase